jgi:hypothetical protein
MYRYVLSLNLRLYLNKLTKNRFLWCGGDPHCVQRHFVHAVAHSCRLLKHNVGKFESASHLK